MEGDFESARQKYKPRIIRFLLVAEAPPKLRSKRFFYFEGVRKADSLFLETMRALYPHEFSDTRAVRRQKCKFLKKFKNDGFYLIDASDEPMCVVQSKVDPFTGDLQVEIDPSLGYNSA